MGGRWRKAGKLALSTRNGPPRGGPSPDKGYRKLTRPQIVSRLDSKSAVPYGFAQGKWKSHAPACSQRFPLRRYPMPLSLTTLSLVASPVTLQEGLKILERADTLR